MEKKRETYGLSTAIAMIVGIVVGSGIFFKADNILLATGGSVTLGVISLCIGAFGIIFGSLSFSEFALRSKGSGGFVAYFEEFLSIKTSWGFGLFQTLIYYPTVQVVTSWATVIYLLITTGNDISTVSLETQIIYTFFVVTLLILINTLSRVVGAYMQNLGTVIKLIPLFLIAALGLFYTGPLPSIPAGVDVVSKSNVGITWLAGLAPIAFSYDGWPIATSISLELKNRSRNMPLALVISPLLILLSYLVYFVGITNLLGSEFIMSMGDEHLSYASNMLFGEMGGKFIMVFVTIAILAVANGVALGGIRMPQALGEKGLFSKSVATIHPKYQVSIKSSIYYWGICMVWLGVHYLTQKSGIIGDRDVSEIAIVFSYVSYILLYRVLIKMYLRGEVKSKIRGFFAPILATFGSLIILVGAIISNPFYISLFILFCFTVFIIGYSLAKKRE